VVMATRWFRGMHPVAPEMDPRMRLVLLSTLVSVTAFFVFVVSQRRRQLELSERVAALEAQRTDQESWIVDRGPWTVHKQKKSA
jgi:hypothetical protein